MDILETFNFFDDYMDCMKSDFFYKLEMILDNFETRSIDESESDIKNFLQSNKSELTFTEIKIGEKYYRARPDCNHMKGAIDDLSIDITFPYYDLDIGAPPTTYCKSGRFNRESYSYLYLATSKETCVSELKLDVSQVCTIAKFESVKSGKYIDLRKPTPKSLMYCLNKILLLPVNTENKYIYYLTQAFSSVIKQLGIRGIIYPSSKNLECDDYNVVAFYPDDFKYIKYSEKLFSIEKIEYTISNKDESYKRYKDYDKLLNDYNEYEEDKNEKLFEYIQEKIKYEIEHKQDNKS